MSSLSESEKPPAPSEMEETLIWQDEDLIGKSGTLTLVIRPIKGDLEKASVQARNGMGLDRLDRFCITSQKARAAFISKLPAEHQSGAETLLILAPEKIRAEANKKKTEKDDWKAPQDPYEELAATIIEEKKKATRPIIYISNDDFYAYSAAGVYAGLHADDLALEIREAENLLYEKNIKEFMASGAIGKNRPKPVTVTEAVKREARGALRDALLKGGKSRDGKPLKLNAHSDVLNVQNGLLDLKSMELRPHTPEFLSTVQFKARYDRTAKCTLWLETLRQIFANDSHEVREEKIRLLQQFFGLCLVPDTTFQKVLILLGEGANGKSLVLFILRTILGEENYSTIGLDQLQNNFYLHELKNKLANISTEISSKAPISDATLKQISGEDPITADRKFHDPVKFQAFARLIFAMNDVPPIADRSHAFFRRLIVVEFTRIFSEEEQNHHLREALLAEIDGILLWMIDGLGTLRSAKRFSVSEEMQNAVARFRKENNTVIGFVEDWLQICELGEVPKESVFAAYKEWCSRSDVKGFSQNRFSRVFKSCYPGVADRRGTGGQWIWSGVAFSSNAPDTYVFRKE